MPRKSPEAIRAALLKDPNTAKLAESVKLSFEEYVKLVIHFATTGAEPEFFVVSDVELKRRGHTPPNLTKMNAWLTEAVAVKFAREATDFQEQRKKLVSLGKDLGY